MKRKTLSLLAVVVALVFGCRDSHDHDDGDGHVHADGSTYSHGDGHDHGDGGGHAHTAKFGGTLVELGEHQYQMEVVRDAESGKMKAWLMDGHAENYVRVKTESFDVTASVGDKSETLAFMAMPNSATGETVGDTSYFEAQADWLKTTSEFDSQIVSLEVRGSKFENLKFNFPKGNEQEVAK
jgi:ABC-type Zn2+ transport system substrate-binding protein/surface adhesin